MPTTLAFDVYGTLIDTHGVVAALTDHIGDDAARFSHAWRDKQLEYAFRRGLMNHYEDFSVCTAQALDHTCAAQGVTLTAEQKTALLQIYGKLPPFPDAPAALAQLQDAGHRLYAFSNGSRAAVDNLLSHAGLRDHFEDIVSVDEIKTFKPAPSVYTHFADRANTKLEDAWLISSNPFDVIGALTAGMKAAWVQRAAVPFDPWGITPTKTITTLTDLPAQLS